jgi:hypothetical protein
MSQRSATPRNSLGTLVCFSHLRWGFVTQRPQHLMKRAADNHSVIFWEEPMFEATAQPRLARFPQHDCLEVITPILQEGTGERAARAHLRSLLEARLREEGERSALLAWYVTPMMLPFSAHLRRTLTIYDKMDELSGFKNAPEELNSIEKQLLSEADLVFTGGRSLYEASRAAHANVHAFPSSIDKAHFASARSPQSVEPQDQSSIKPPRIGWFGVIDERMDLDLVSALAERRPDWQFVMVGPVVKIDPAILPRRSNIHWLGFKTYSELPAYLAGWDAGIMPFAINDSTRFISPTKTPEYLAAGVPVAATPVRDIVRPYGERGLVEIAATVDEMIQALSRALSKPRPPWLHQVDSFLADMSWDRTWEEMHALMQASCAELSEGEAA